MAQANANEYWSENVKEHFHTPPGTFTQDAEEITNILLKVSDGNATLALRRLLFYMNRAGSRLGIINKGGTYGKQHANQF